MLTQELDPQSAEQNRKQEVIGKLRLSLHISELEYGNGIKCTDEGDAEWVWNNVILPLLHELETVAAALCEWKQLAQHL